MGEEVEKTNPDLVKRDRDGKLQTVCYDAVKVMLLNEFLKEHRKVQEQANRIAELKDEMQISHDRQRLNDANPKSNCPA